MFLKQTPDITKQWAKKYCVGEKFKSGVQNDICKNNFSKSECVNFKVIILVISLSGEIDAWSKL
jgi:hypothetical protein